MAGSDRRPGLSESPVGARAHVGAAIDEEGGGRARGREGAPRSEGG